MRYLFTLLLSFFTFAGLAAMESPRGNIIFENNRHKLVEIPREVVQNNNALNTAYQSHKLESSIGTLGYVRIIKPELQNFELLNDCLEYNKMQPDQIRSMLSSKLSDISHLIKVMEMATELHMPYISKAVAQMIGNQFQSIRSRCEAFKADQLTALRSKPEILNQIAQAIIEPTGTKYYWLTRVKEQNKDIVQNLNIEQQLNNHLSPQAALLLVDAYENRVNNTPLSYAPGAEMAVPTGLRGFVKMSKAQALAHTWKHTKSTHKWSLAGVGAASLAAAGYGLYSWYTAK